MKESASESLTHIGFNFGFTLFFFGILYGVWSCILKCYSHDDHHYHDNNNNDDHVSITITRRVGVKPYILRSIPIIEFNSKDFKDSVECVVCLSELVDGAKARVLPSCNHCFHVECIDSWFRSHSTCPICRKRVCLEQPGTRPEFGGGDENSTQIHDQSSEHRGIPTDSSPRSTDTAVVEDADCGGANEGPPDLTEVVIDIPAKEISSSRSTDTAVVEDADCGGANEGPPSLTAVVIDIPAKEISSPRSTDTAVVEDADCGRANEGPPDLTAVVIDIPAGEIKSGPC